MKATWLTDIHLDHLHDEDLADFVQEVDRQRGDVVLISGDIGQAPTITTYLGALSAGIRCPIYFVLGNHDFYFGSVEEVRRRVTEQSQNVENLHYLSDEGVVRLSADTCLIGHDGWGDGRHGLGLSSRVRLNDFEIIEELKGLTRIELLRRLAGLGDEAADHIAAHLSDALQHYSHVVVLTHVPPFREAAVYQGRPADDQWAPFFVCKAVGDVLSAETRLRPDRTVTVLCGHSHGPPANHLTRSPNLHVHTGAAVYGSPEIQRTFDWP